MTTSEPLQPGTMPPASVPGGATPAGSAPAVPASSAAPPTASTDSSAREHIVAVRNEITKAIVGQDAALTGIILALLAGGHVLLEGPPGVAKTLMARATAQSLDLEMTRLQFTPDLMPGDVTGSLMYDARTAEFTFRPGPVFTQLLLADEINRTPPKTQAALLEAMEERQVSVDGVPRPLPEPFMVLGTQNPLEFEGTYPLSEAQVDRFLLHLVLPLPEREEEIAVLQRHVQGFDPRDLAAAGLHAVATAEDLARAREEVAQVQAGREVLGYIVDLIRATREAPSIQRGASPRGATALLACARAWAWLSARSFITPDDVKAIALPVLRHRLALHPEAELEGMTSAAVITQVLREVAVPR